MSASHKRNDVHFFLKHCGIFLKSVIALATEEEEIRYDPKQVNYKQLIDVIDDTGFGAMLISTEEDKNKVDL